jgi:uncharacterized protein
MYSRFALTLMVNHACNLRCIYCYTGAKFDRAMPAHVARQAVDRALASLHPGADSRLELGFFGGEPLLEAGLIFATIEYARAECVKRDAGLSLSLTTNGTRDDDEAWRILTLSGLDLAISHDGLPRVHDQERPFHDQRPSSEKVLATMRRLREAGKEFRVAMVVRPGSLPWLSAGIEFLRQHGVARFDLSLDLWTCWTPADAAALESAIVECGRLWRQTWPELSLNWFDEKAVTLSGAPCDPTARCGFGAGQVAVAPSGRLYPCERLIGEDAPGNLARLPGDTLDGADFLQFRHTHARQAEACTECAVQRLCNTTCGCSNYIRTGHARMPDGLLCMFNQVCLRETALALPYIQSGDRHAIVRPISV